MQHFPISFLFPLVCLLKEVTARQPDCYLLQLHGYNLAQIFYVSVRRQKYTHMYIFMYLFVQVLNKHIKFSLKYYNFSCSHPFTIIKNALKMLPLFLITATWQIL